MGIGWEQSHGAYLANYYFVGLQFLHILMSLADDRSQYLNIFTLLALRQAAELVTYNDRCLSHSDLTTEFLGWSYRSM